VRRVRGRPFSPRLFDTASQPRVSFCSSEGEEGMATKGHRVQIKLKSSESSYIYYVKKNKQNTPDRLELKKYDPIVRKHVAFKESR
jgi:large subunit ribosomal protein L33